MLVNEAVIEKEHLEESDYGLWFIVYLVHVEATDILPGSSLVY